MQQEVKKQIKREDLILLRTRPRPFDRSYEGLPVLFPVWNMLVSLERAFHASDFYLGKIGHGLFSVKTRGKVSDTRMSQIQSTVEDASASRVLVLNGQNIEEIGFINASGTPVNFPDEIDSRLGIIAAGVGIPKDLLIGLSAGSITGSETNVKSLYETLNSIQTSCMPAMRELDFKLGATGDYTHRFIRRYAHDEESQSKIAMNEAQTWAIRSGWLTTNEIREQQGLPPVENGDQLKSDFAINVAGFQSPEEEEATNNEEGVNL